MFVLSKTCSNYTLNKNYKTFFIKQYSTKYFSKNNISLFIIK